jgi:hypothetical protein
MSTLTSIVEALLLAAVLNIGEEISLGLVPKI